MCAITPVFNLRHRWLHCHSCRYIHLVQHLIEKCLLFCMDRDDCVKALAKHAKIQPPITIAVWEELLKENPGFFSAYLETLPRRRSRSTISPLPFNDKKRSERTKRIKKEINEKRHI